uniref:Uncharacterized protein n=1 Tax=Knipowitschia caucasica TaxID=637954 RepID=A0AAV2JB14_KNICA
MDLLERVTAGDTVMSPVRPGVERVEQPQVGSPSAPFEETEVKSLSLVRSPRDVLVDVRIARLKYEREKEEREFQLKREIALKRIEAEAVTAREVAFKKIEADAALRMRQLELQSAGRSPVSSSPVVSAPEFDVTKNIHLVPTFRETEVESYFCVFERIAGALHWPRDVWAILLQCNLSGRASEACASLAVSDMLDYDCVKGAILRFYESWPKAHSAYVSPAHVVGAFPIAVRDQSSIDGVESIMWDDSAGGKVCPMSVLTHAQSERGWQSDVGNSVLAPDFAGVGAPSCGRTDNTTVYIEKPELITSVSPPPTDKKAGRKFSLAGLVLSCGIPGPTKLLDEVSTEIRQFDPDHNTLVSLALMSNPDQRLLQGALLTVDYTVRISTGVERTMLWLRPLGVTGDLHYHLGGGGGTHILSHFAN